MSPDPANCAKDSAKETVSEVKRILEALQSSRISTLCDSWKLRELFQKNVKSGIPIRNNKTISSIFKGFL